MPMIHIVEQLPCVSAPRQSQDEDGPATLGWRSSNLNAENLAHLSEMNLPHTGWDYTDKD